MSAAGGLSFLAKLHSRVRIAARASLPRAVYGSRTHSVLSRAVACATNRRFAPREPANAQDQSRNARWLLVWFKLFSIWPALHQH